MCDHCEFEATHMDDDGGLYCPDCAVLAEDMGIEAYEFD